MPQPEEEFHLETSKDENTNSSYSAHDAMKSSDSDEDNEPTPESHYFVAHILCTIFYVIIKVKVNCT